MPKFFILITTYILLCHGVCAQICNTKIGYKITEGTKIYTAAQAFGGGLNNPQFGSIDINNDGTADLIIFDKNDNTLKFFEANAAANTYTQPTDFINTYHASLPAIVDYVVFQDYNSDGLVDLFTATPNFTGIRVFKNVSVGSNIAFFLVNSLVFSQQPVIGNLPIQISNSDYPAAHDADNDGDTDLLTFNANGSLVEFHKNKSMELHGVPDSLIFELTNVCWGNFAENFFDNTVILNNCNALRPKNNPENGAHSGSTLLMIDTDGDSDKDLILGDISHNNLVQLTNGGTNAAPLITAYDYEYPPNTTPADVPLFPACFYIDVDFDGKKDLITSPNSRNNSNNFQSAWLYKNTNTNTAPVFQLLKTDFVQSTMLDLGWNAYPTIFDENNDDKPDIIVGNYGYFGQNSLQYTAKLALLRNTSTNPQNPEFELITRDYLNLSTLNKTNLHPTTADIDADGDLDLFIGDDIGNIMYYKNMAVANAPADFIFQTATYFNIDVGQAAAPVFFDLNQDAKLDIIVGERTGRIQFYANSGTAAAATFATTPTNAKLGNIDVLIPCCTGFATPHVAVDSAGVPKLFVGAEDGKIYVYTNILNNITGNFSLIDSINTHASRTAPVVFDMNNDGKPELIWGERGGGLGVCTKINIGTNDVIYKKNTVKITRTTDGIGWQLAHTIIAKKIEIYNALGQCVSSQNINKNSGNILINAQNTGVFIFKITTDEGIFTQKFIF